jgi:hypothetical protein
MNAPLGANENMTLLFLGARKSEPLISVRTLLDVLKAPTACIASATSLPVLVSHSLVFVIAMLLVRPIAFLSFVVFALSKPHHVGNVVPQQAGSSLSPDQTICGDIVINANNGEWKNSNRSWYRSSTNIMQATTFSMQTQCSDV